MNGIPVETRIANEDLVRDITVDSNILNISPKNYIANSKHVGVDTNN